MKSIAFARSDARAYRRNMILVTGATGKVGSDLVHELTSRAEPVRALVRDPEKAARTLPPEVELVRGDLGDAGSIAAALEGADRLFLLSPPTDNMLDLERIVIDAVVAAGGVPHLVKLSAIGADAASRHFITHAHGVAEAAIRDARIPFTFLRPNFFLQNLLGSAASIKSQGAIYQPGANERASHIDTRDIAAVAAAVLTDPARHIGQAYTLTGPESLTFQQVADILTRVTGKPVKYVDVPRDAAKQAMLGAGMTERYAEAISELMDDYRAGKMSAVTPDVERVTGRKPRTLEQFVTENRAAFA
jgi:uncharacterized protein YbjT (DUF2867 family)